MLLLLLRLPAAERGGKKKEKENRKRQRIREAAKDKRRLKVINGIMNVESRYRIKSVPLKK